MRSGALLLLALGPACTGDLELRIAAPAGWTSAIVAELYPDRVSASAHASAEALHATARDGDVEVIAAFYAETLAELGLEEGPVTLGARTRRLPTPSLGAFARAVASGALGAVEPLTPEDPRLARVLLPELTTASCALTARCLSLEADGRACTRECDGPAGFVNAPVEPPTVTPPEPPASPSPPCPEAWRATGCAPPRPLARVACTTGEAQLPGSAVCAPIGGPCAAGQWPEGLPTDREIRFVAADGSLDPLGRPAFFTIAEALAGAPPSTIFALSRGPHGLEDVSLPAGAELIGTCARDTQLIASRAVIAGDARATGLEWSGSSSVSGRLALEGVTLLAAVFDVQGELEARDFLAIGSTLRAQGGALALSRGVLEDADVFARGGTVEARGLVFSGTTPLRLEGGAVATASDLALYDGSRAVLSSAAALELEDAYALGRDADLPVIFAQGATVSLRRAAFELDDGRVLTATASARASITDLLASARGAPRPMLEVTGATLALSRATLRGAHPRALDVGDGATARAEDLTIESSTVTDEADPAGLIAVRAGALELDRASLRGPARVGLDLSAGGAALLRDVSFERLQIGAYVANSALTLERAGLSELRELALAAVARAALSLRDVAIFGVSAGVALDSEARLEGARLSATGGRGPAISVGPSATASVSALSASRWGDPLRAPIDTGISVAAGGSLSLFRSELSDIDGVAIDVGDGAERILLEEVRVASCASYCLDAHGGDFVVRGLLVDQRMAPSPELGRPAIAIRGTTRAFAAERLRVLGAPGTGLGISNGELTLNDARLEGSAGTGLSLTGPARGRTRAVTVAGASGYGLWVRDGASLEAEDLHIFDVVGGEQRGRGVALGDDVDVELTRLRVERADDACIYLPSRGGLAAGARRVVIDDALLRGARTGITDFLGPAEAGALQTTRVRLRDVGIDVQSE